MARDGKAEWERCSIALNEEGVYICRCEPRTVMAMVGIIQVGVATNKGAAIQAAKKLFSEFSLNNERLSKYLAQLGGYVN